jgi:signal recognition particle subunit SRP54
MFDNLTDRLSRTLKNVRGQGRLTEDNIKATLREVRMALLEADVALPVVKAFVDRVRERALGQEVMQSLTPGQELVRIVRDELVAVMGEANEELDLRARPPAVVLMAGLQGSGKTTTVGKLGGWLKGKGRKVMVVSCDVYRPAAIDQLETLAGQVGVEFYPSKDAERPDDIAGAALEAARRAQMDVLLVDTAGRLHVDADMMEEIRRLHGVLEPAETLFVVDAMTGQDAANTAKAFDEALPLTGVVLTKADGDARGGAALSVRHVTGKPIKFIGMGEKPTALEPFHPDRIASRILGMGDVLSLIEEVETKVDREQAEKLATKLKKGKGFDLEDFAEQLRQMRNMGGLAGLLDKMPGMSDLPAGVRDQVNDREVVRMEAIINSMTPQERRFPAIIKGSRRKRIAAGSGTQVQDVNKLLKQFTQMQKMMKRVKKKGGMARMMQGMKGGGMPPGMPPM